MTHIAELPLSLYVHLPWCVKKCPYCDFNSHQLPAVERRDTARDDYVAAVLEDIRLQVRQYPGRALHSIFIGGGTPSVFTPAEIAAIVAAAEAAWGFEPEIEVTMEVNPGVLERDSFAGYAAAGVNRVSIGAQSFDAAALQRLGRLHGPDEIVRAVDEAQRAGFERINVDVMHGLPGQTIAAGVADIHAAIALGVTHVSHYQLTLEPNTVFYASPPTLPDEDVLQSIGEQSAASLRAAGFVQYEVSAWTQPGDSSRHNLNYWRFGDYLAVGAGAHGKLTVQGTAVRYAQPMHPNSYVDQLKAQRLPEIVPVPAASLAFEYFLNRLRLLEMVDLRDFERRTGLAALDVSAQLGEAAERGLIDVRSATQFELTTLGQRFLNDLQAIFLPS
ncbi:MAG: radical SAM family heme chaperone HemW [Pseudomonadota bacterium]